MTHFFVTVLNFNVCELSSAVIIIIINLFIIICYIIISVMELLLFNLLAFYVDILGWSFTAGR